MWLTVKGFEFGKYFPCSQELSGALSSVPLWYSSSSTLYFKDDVLHNFFFFCQLHTVLGQSLPHLETQFLSILTNPKSILLTKTHFLKSKSVYHTAYEISTWMQQRYLKPNMLIWTPLLPPPTIPIPLFFSIIFLLYPPSH